MNHGEINTIAPLFNFEFEGEEVDLGILCLRRLSDADTLALNRASLWAGRPYTPLDALRTSYALGRTYLHKQSEPWSIDESVLDDVRRIITALRLLKPGDIGVNYVCAMVDLQDSGQFFLAQPALDCETRPYGGTAYKLSSTDFDRLQNVMTLVAAATKRGAGLTLALRRFNQSYSRSRGEDRVIDLTIALESSVLADVPQELGYRLSLRGAALLAHVKPCLETSSLLEAMYKVRSKIVHEGKSLTDRNVQELLGKPRISCTPIGFPDACESVTREILNEYVTRTAKGKTVEQVNRQLEGAILAGLHHSDGTIQRV